MTTFTDEERDLLKRVRERIAKGFGKGDWAFDKDGKPASPLSDKATCWCIRGAVSAELPDDQRFNPTHEIESKLQEFVPDSFPYKKSPEEINDSLVNLVGYNDWEKTTQADMLALLDKAIAS